MKRWTLPGLLAISLTAATFHVSTPTQLRQALQSAATNGEADTILLAPGIYRTTDGNATFEYLSNEEYNLTLRGADPATTILSGEHTHRILKHTSIKKATMILERLTFKDGNSSIDNRQVRRGLLPSPGSSTSFPSMGGGILSDYDLVIKECNFTGNQAHLGGGIYTNGSITITNTTFTHNHAKDNGGGFHAGSTKVTNSTFTNNTAKNEGGGFHIGSATVTNSTFTDNNATDGGGFKADSATVTNTTFTDNHAEDNGGGFYISGNLLFGIVIMRNCIFTDNNATEGGGFKANSATVTNTTFTDNHAEDNGGGFYAESATVTNSIFTNNTGDGGGGFSVGRIHASNLLMIGNENEGITIRSSKDSTIYNSIFLQNGAYDIKIADGAILAHLNHNYIDLSKVLGSHFAKENIFGMDPGFVDEATGDYHLCGDSPLVDAGTTELEGLQLPQKDMDGNARVVGASIDIGPYEYSTTRPTILDVRVLGEPKEGHKITLQVDYSLAEGRSLASITYDYEGDGTFVPEASHIYDKPGTYEIAVKVTDDAGEFSIKKITLTIQKEDLRDKLAKILTPEQIEQVLPIIEQEKEVALQNALPIQQPKSDTAAILDQIAGKPLPIKGYYLHYGTGLFEWIYVPHSLKSAYKLERGIRSGYRLVWTPFPNSTHIEKIGESIVLTPTQ